MNPFQGLTEPGHKNRLQFPTRILDELIAECGFTDEEIDILRMRGRGLSLLEISFRMEDKYGRRYPGGQYSDRKVDRRIRSIKDKIAYTLERAE